MIDLTNSVLLKQLNSQLARGKILKTEILFPEGPRFKRLILLNNDFSEDDLYYLLTTSQVDFYKEYGNLQPLKGNYIYIQKGGTRINPNEDMAIDCRRVDIFEKGKLLSNYRNIKLKFLSIIPKEIMAEIDKIISFSKLITQNIKDHII